jgi:hypothetical protein
MRRIRGFTASGCIFLECRHRLVYACGNHGFIYTHSG